VPFARLNVGFGFGGYSLIRWSLISQVAGPARGIDAGFSGQHNRVPLAVLFCSIAR
jgi:hypothetical protein